MSLRTIKTRCYFIIKSRIANFQIDSFVIVTQNYYNVFVMIYTNRHDIFIIFVTIVKWIWMDYYYVYKYFSWLSSFLFIYHTKFSSPLFSFKFDKCFFINNLDVKDFTRIQIVHGFLFLFHPKNEFSLKFYWFNDKCYQYTDANTCWRNHAVIWHFTDYISRGWTLLRNTIINHPLLICQKYNEEWLSPFWQGIINWGMNKQCCHYAHFV